MHRYLAYSENPSFVPAEAAAQTGGSHVLKVLHRGRSGKIARNLNLIAATRVLEASQRSAGTDRDILAGLPKSWNVELAATTGPRPLEQPLRCLLVVMPFCRDGKGTVARSDPKKKLCAAFEVGFLIFVLWIKSFASFCP